MPFIGNQPALSYTSFAKQDFTTSATTSYTLDNPVTNENELALFINFVRQEPTTAYTASGTSLTLTSATSASDDMYCVFLGKAVQTVNPPAGSVGASQISDGSIALGKLSATGTKDATTFLRGDNSFSTLPTSGITQADMWRLTTNTSLGSKISSNLERVDSSGFGYIGTGMSQSSGDWSFPETGIYLVKGSLSAINPITSSEYIGLNIKTTIDNSSYTNVAESYDSISGTDFYANAVASTIFDVTNTSTHKLQFFTVRQNANSQALGGTTISYTWFQFIRLGDT